MAQTLIVLSDITGAGINVMFAMDELKAESSMITQKLTETNS
jgi:hypothetical protein